jgi:TonB family protein
MYNCCMKTLRLFILFLFALGHLSAQAIEGSTTQSKDSTSVMPKAEAHQVNAAEVKADAKVFEILEKTAEFKGGMNKLYSFIGNQVQYPIRCMEANIEGVVILEFVVDTDGSISNVRTRTKHKSCPEMDAEAIRVIKMTSRKWTPGSIGDSPVRSQYRLPVRFNIG